MEPRTRHALANDKLADEVRANWSGINEPAALIEIRAIFLICADSRACLVPNFSAEVGYIRLGRSHKRPDAGGS